MALLLLAAAAVSGLALGERVDALAIITIVALNTVIGVTQEGKATRALEALRTLDAPTATVVREGVPATVAAREVVPGDVVVLAAGDRVPADVRLTEAVALEVDESLLTGESLPAVKDPFAPPLEDAGLADRPWALFAGTLVTRGTGRGVVQTTAHATELGRIAASLDIREPPTPLQVELAKLTARLGAMAVVVAAGVFALTLFRTAAEDGGFEEAFLAAVALAVAAVPEGLATVVTVSLALGVRRMADEGAIVRHLPAVETLGCATVILTDKTGTLTENRLRLEKVVLLDEQPAGLDTLEPAVRSAVAEVAVLCNDASIDHPTGDPVDVALLEAVPPAERHRLRTDLPRLDSVPFDSSRRRMTTLHRSADGLLLLVKGAPETVVDRCSVALRPDGAAVPLDDHGRHDLLAATTAMSVSGARTLALARRQLTDEPGDLTDEHELTFVALVGLHDPIRREARAAVTEARRAGIRLAMVTGDHPGTAAAIGTQAGLLEPGAPSVTGADLRRHGVPPDPLSVPVYARVDPDQKLALVESLEQRGHVVAVTGDGVNDAPALRSAAIGVAMGRGGTEVARQAADMVITDDNLASLVTAVRQGRGIYDNIRKVVDYLVAGNLSEILVVVVGLLSFPALGVPLLPVQLLWINLLTDGLPAIALGVDPFDPSVMRRPPRKRTSSLLDLRRLRISSGRAMLIAGTTIASLVVARYIWDEPWSHARAVMFTTLVVAHLLYALAVSAGPRPAQWTITSHAGLIAAVGLGIGLQALVVVVPGLHGIFDTAWLTPREWLLVAAGGVLPLVVMLGLAGRRRAVR
jgi:Ca2+-transporting ATPase